MGRRGLALLLGFALAGCTQHADPPHAPSQVPVAPITAPQVGDLMSRSVQNKDGNLFVTVEPDQCSGAAREVNPPLIVDHAPVATDGGHWMTDDGRGVYIEELAGVYHADFDAKAALADAKRTLESCRGVPFTVTSMRGRTYVFTLLQINSASPDIVLWSYRGADWACDNAFVAAHNAALELATCSPVNGYDVLSLARDALKRIERLANTTA
jgi:PknH-like extracellular domain